MRKSMIKKGKFIVGLMLLLSLSAVVVMGAAATVNYNTSRTYTSATDVLDNRGYYLSSTTIEGGSYVGDVLIIGGNLVNDSGSDTNTVLRYDASADSWSYMASMNTDRSGTGFNSAYYNYSSQPLVLVAGGGTSADENAGTKSTESYNASTNVWTNKANMNSARAQLTLVSNGETDSNSKIYAIGGRNGSTYYSSIEAFDHSSNTWTNKASMRQSRVLPAATLLSDGKILVVGGWSGSALNSCEIYDPDSNTWTDTTDLPDTRYDAGLFTLDNGDAILIGGLGGSDNTDTYYYNTEDETWSEGPSLHTSRSGAAVAQLTDTKYIIAGGHSGGNYLGDAFIYTFNRSPKTELSSPANEASYDRSDTASVTLNWTATEMDAGDAVTKSEIKIGTTSGGSNILSATDKGTATSHTFTFPVAETTTYYWSVRSYDDTDWSDWTTRSIDVAGDTTAPSKPGTPILEDSSNSGDNGDNVTNDTTPTISGTAEANSTVNVYVGNDVEDTASVDGSGDWSYTLTSKTDGGYVIKVTATDAAGNTSVESNTLTITIDNSAPAKPGTPNLLSEDDSGSSSIDNKTNVTTPTINGTGEANATAQIFVDGSKEDEVFIDGTGNWNYDLNNKVDGDYDITVYVVDAADNTSVVSNTLTLYIDDTNPNKPSTPNLQTSDDSGNNSDDITNITNPTIDGTAEADSTVTIYIDNVEETTVTASGAGAWSYELPNQADGNYEIKVTATDVYGNVSADSDVLSLTIDDTNPDAPSVPDLDTSDDSGVLDSDNNTNVTTPKIIGTSEANATIHILKDAVEIDTVTASGAGSWSYDFGVLGDGTYSITVKASDTAGNESGFTAGLSLTIDNTNPTASAVGSIIDTNGLRLTVTASDTNAIEYAYSTDGVNYGSYSNSASNDFTGLGTNTNHSLYVSVRDVAGNSVVKTVTLYTASDVPGFVSHTANEDGTLDIVITQGTNPDITKYCIEKATTDDFGDASILVDWTNPVADTFVISKNDLTPGADYFIRVKSRNEDSVESAYNTGDAYAVQTVPEIPEQPTVTVNSTTEIKIDWSSINHADTSINHADSYILYDNGVQVVETAELTYTHQSIGTDTEHIYTVKSKNEAGLSLASTSTSRYTYADIPEIEELISIPDGSVNIYVDEKDNPDSTEYMIEGSKSSNFSDSFTSNWENPGSNVINFADGAIEYGESYFFRIKARNGDDVETDFGSNIAFVSTVPGGVSNFTAIPRDGYTDRFDLTWDAVDSAYDYGIYRDGSFVKWVEGTSTTDTGLEPNTGCQYQIAARNSSGLGAQSDQTDLAYTDAAIPAVMVQSRADGGLDVSIDRNESNVATEYYVEVSSDSEDFTGGNLKSTVVWTTDLNHEISSVVLESNTNYYVRVKAKNSSDKETLWSEIVIGSTVLLQPNQPTLTVISEASIQVDWDDVGADSYKVLRDGVEIATVAAKTYTDTELMANRSYSYSIIGTVATGDSEASNQVSIYTKAALPTTVTITESTTDSLKFLIDTSDNFAFPKYVLELKLEGTDTGVKTTSWSQAWEYEFTGLSTDDSYDLWIKAKNADGEITDSAKILQGIYCNRAPVGGFSDDGSGTLVYKSSEATFNTPFSFAGEVSDPDEGNMTVTATIDGSVTSDYVYDVVTSLTGTDNFTLTWDVWGLSEGTYNGVSVLITDEYGATDTIDWLGTLIVDRQAPTVTLNGETEEYFLVDPVGVYNDQGANAVDNGDAGLNGAVSVSGTVDMTTVGEYELTYTAVDNAGNTTVKSRTIHIVEADNVDTPIISNVDGEKAVFNGQILSLGPDSTTTDYGFVYGLSTEPTVADSKIQLSNAAVGSYYTAVEGLSLDTQYFVRAYIVNDSAAVLYSEEATFTTLTVSNDKPLFDVAKTSYTVNEDGGTVDITIRRHYVTAGEMTLDYATADVSALDGSDYTAVSGTVTFADGETSKTVTVNITNDGDVEVNEVFNFVISNPVVTADPTVEGVILTDTAEITIVSEDLVVLSSDKVVTDFELAGEVGVIDEGAKTITLSVPYGTVVSDIAPTVMTISPEASIQPSADVTRDFGNTLVYTVVAEDSTFVNYMVTVNVQPLGTDAMLSNLTIKDSTDASVTVEPVFIHDNYYYDATVANDIESIVLVPVLSDSKASVTIDGIAATNNTDSDAVELSVGSNVIDIIVTAEDGVATKSYRLTVVRQAPDAGSMDADLTSLTVSQGTLDPVFDKATRDYKIDVENSISSISVNAVTSDSSSGMVIKGNGVVIAVDESMELREGSNLITVQITSTGGAEKTYAIAITRKEEASSSNSSGDSSSGSTSSGSSSSGSTSSGSTSSGSTSSGSTSDETVSEGTNGGATGTMPNELEDGTLEDGITQEIRSTGNIEDLNSLNDTLSEGNRNTVEVAGENVTFEVPLNDFETDVLGEELGLTEEQVNASNVTVSVDNIIGEKKDDIIEKAINSGSIDGNITIVGPVYEFGVTIETPDDRTIELEGMSQYSQREMNVDPSDLEGVTEEDMNDLTVVFIDAETGEVTPVLSTQVVNEDGTIDFKFMHDGLGTYTVVRNDSDVSLADENNWAAERATQVINSYNMSDIFDEKVDLNADMTRGQVAAAMCRVLGMQSKTLLVQTYFNDLSSTDPLYTDIVMANMLDVMNGYGDGTVRAGSPITREETAKVIYNTYVLLKRNAGTYDVDKEYLDEAAFYEWSKEAIEILTKDAVFEGYPDGKFHPDNKVSIAEVLQLIVNMEEAVFRD